MTPRPLGEFLRAAGVTVPDGLPEVSIRGLRLDSRQVRPGEMFLALRGHQRDGADFAGDAVRRGAAVVAMESVATEAPRCEGGTWWIPISGLRREVGPLFDAWHGFPSRHLKAFGVTGTNGKSTTTLLMTALLRAAGRKVVSLGTIRYDVDGEIAGANLTTPGPDVFFELLARAVAKGCDALAMEMSSHALSQDRIRGVRFDRAVFTNLTQDHFDFHGGFEDYFAAKKKLFTEYLTADGLGIVNLDTPYGVRLLAEWDGPRFTFSRAETPEGRLADVTLDRQDLTLTGTQLVLSHRGRSFAVRSRLVGALNIENLLAAAAFGLSLGLPAEVLAAGLADVSVPGRNEVFRLPGGAFAVVDYAHTPDALERVLQSLRPLTAGRLWCVFGCGGDRDRSKRPLMGAIAERLADRVVLTSDNPRSEDPEAILREIRGGLHRPEQAEVTADRRAAIRGALASLQNGDCLLVAGKGHEDYQILGNERRHFSDQEEVVALEARAGENAVELNLAEMAVLLRTAAVGPKPGKRRVEICTDSRALRRGEVFWALHGPNFDGHGYVEECFQKGGLAAVVEREWYEQNGKPVRVYVPVGDTQQALLTFARAYAAGFRIPKIAVTGSNGKTTTKDMIASVLRRAGKTLATEGNFNNHIGVPLTLFGLRRTHRFAVLEMGTNHPGEIEVLSQTAQPNLAVVTNIGWSHLEHFGSKEAIRDEKLSIISGFPRAGTLFLNVDDPLLCEVRPGPRCRVVTFGIHRGQVRPDDVTLGADGCAAFRIGRTQFQLTVPGLHNVYNALAAVAVALHLRVPKGEAATALAAFSPPEFRMQIRRLGTVLLLDDCYNANPSSLRAALSTLASYQVKGRRIAVLGDMLELGPESEKLHVEIGHYLVEMGVDALYTFGGLSRHINQGARDKGFPRHSAHHFSDFELMASELSEALRPGDVVLVKASRGMRLERVYESLRARAKAGVVPHWAK